jgi:DNA-binding response OmpR family regulator
MNDFDPSIYRILVVDDDTLVLEMIEETLRRGGFQTAAAPSGEDALDWMKRHGLPHLAVLDINMPFGMDGIELCQTIHTFCDLPIIMLTAVEDEDTITFAIDSCAEDYLTKPFLPGELIARIRRILRRIGGFAYPFEKLTQVDERLAIDFAGGMAIVNNRPVPLTPTETKLLYILMRSSGKTINSNFLLRRLWPNDTEHDERLRVYIHRIRSKIEDANPEHQYIRSERGLGYAFVPPETRD